MEKELYLYLVDDFSGLPVFDPKGEYPIVIEVNNAELGAKHVPLMHIGVREMALANGAAGLAQEQVR